MLGAVPGDDGYLAASQEIDPAVLFSQLNHIPVVTPGGDADRSNLGLGTILY